MRAFSRTSTPLTKTLRRYFGHQTTWYLHEYTTLLFPFVLLPILRIGPVNCNSSLGCKKEGNSWFAITSCSTPLLLHDERNGLERVLLHFSHFEKETQKLDEHLYRITPIWPRWWNRVADPRIVLRASPWGRGTHYVSATHEKSNSKAGIVCSQRNQSITEKWGLSLHVWKPSTT